MYKLTKMQLFLDQMIDSRVADDLREKGYDVLCTSEVGMAQADDLKILEYCIQTTRILVTLDDHFGDWTVAKLTEHPGVIRLKVNPTTSSNIRTALIPFLQNNAGRNFSNILAIVKPDGVRWIRTI